MGNQDASSTQRSFPDIPVSAVLPACISGHESHLPRVFAPWLEDLPITQRDLLALLPVVDINGAVFAALGNMRSALSEGYGARRVSVQSGVIAALLCVDPFLRVRDLAALLKAAGISEVTNFPTIQVIDGVAARGFESADLGLQREAQILSGFVQEGLSVTGFATSAENGRVLLDHGVSSLVVHPGLPSMEWRSRVMAARSAEEALQTLRPNCNFPIRLFCPDAYGAELDLARSLADGVVRYV